MSQEARRCGRVTYALLESGIPLQIRIEVAPFAELKHSAECLGVHFCTGEGGGVGRAPLSDKVDMRYTCEFGYMISNPRMTQSLP